MKKLVIHIGYPKTASTTLQDKLFTELHRSGNINFIGRTLSLSDEYRAVYNHLKKILAYNDKYFEPKLDNFNEETPSINEGEIQYFQDLLSNDLVNVISDEELLLPNKSTFGCSLIPKQLHRLFNNQDTNIKIIIILRKQVNLMQSLYAELYHGFHKSTATNTPSKLFFETPKAQTLTPSEYSEIFNFHKMITLYSDIFGKNSIKVMLFEDFINDRDYFLDQLTEFLELSNFDVSSLDSLLDRRNGLRLKPKKDGRYLVSLPQSKSGIFAAIKTKMARLIRGFSPTASFHLKQFFLNHPNLHYLVWGKPATVPSFSEAEKKVIFEYYKDSNRLLITDFDLNAETLKKYGYI